MASKIGSKPRWGLGDEGFEVEWCKNMPSDPDDPTMVDPDNATIVTRDFRTREEADSYAREVYPITATGWVSITPFVLERTCDSDPFDPRYNCFKEYTDDSAYYEGDD